MKFKQLTYTVCIPALLLAQVSEAHAESTESWWKNWNIFGGNTAKVEHIENEGNGAASPYAVGGVHAYSEFDINFSRNYSPYKKFSGQVFGVVNGSDYRNNDEGFVPERLNVLYENGEADTPYRAEFGDYFANVSYRTMQRSLKGAQFELQPSSGYNNVQHSILFFSGANQSSWHDFDASDNYSNGASWLIDHPFWGQWSINSVYTQLDGNRNNAMRGLDQDQWLNSVAFATPVEIGNQSLNVEGEVASFSGDHGTAQSAQDKDDMAYFAEVSGKNNELRQLDYRVRFEQYGADYRPDGAIITPDRRSEEVHVGWRFDGGVRAQGRAQYFHDNFDSTNQQDTITHGLKFTGGLLGDLAPDVSGVVDVYTQSIQDELRTRSLDTQAIDASLSKPINLDWTSEVQGFFQTVDDNTGSGLDNITKQVRVRMHRNVSWEDISGNVSPGLLLRDIDNGSNDRFELEPTLDLNLYKGQHALSANYGYLAQNDLVLGNPNIGTHTAGMNYNYTEGIHELGLEAYYYDRYVQALEDTSTMKVGVYYTLRFNKPASEDGFAGFDVASFAGASQAAATKLDDSISMLSQLVPNSSFDGQISKLTDINFNTTRKVGAHYVYDVQLLDNISQRQRLVLLQNNTQLSKSALIIDIENSGRPESYAQLFGRVLDSIIAEYGSPSRQYEKGSFSGDIRDRVASGKLVRTYEWNTKNGVVRYGIPKSISGEARLEIQHAKSFGSLRNANWGINLP